MSGYTSNIILGILCWNFLGLMTRQMNITKYGITKHSKKLMTLVRHFRREGKQSFKSESTFTNNLQKVDWKVNCGLRSSHVSTTISNYHWMKICRGMVFSPRTRSLMVGEKGPTAPPSPLPAFMLQIIKFQPFPSKSLKQGSTIVRL